MPAKPTYQYEPRARVHTWVYPDATRLTVGAVRQDGRGRLMGDTRAYARETMLNRAHMDLLSQDDRAKFHANV